MSLKYICYLIYLALFVWGNRLKDGPVLLIENGLLKGRKQFTESMSRPYYAFQGIPYAEPPLGSLRFKPPISKKNWKGILDATKDGDVCVQDSNPVRGSEDCLFINVFTPQLASIISKPLPTMVFIHGGGFEGGSSSYSLYGPDYLLDKAVVVVTFNYRLGIFGFLSTGDLTAPGNNGLKDQVLALKWIQRNIRRFGGDPKQVTIFGQSAGSVSVSYHLQSPKSQGLFQRAIMESGVSLCLWGFSRNIRNVALMIGRQLSIETNSSQILINNLRKIDHVSLQEASVEAVGQFYALQNPMNGFVFGPVSEPEHDGAFFTGKSHELLKNGKYSKVPTVIGFNSLEGSFNFSFLLRLYFVQFDLFPNRLTPASMNITNDVTLRQVGSEIRINYLGKVPIFFANYTLMKFISDNHFVRPIREFARLISKDVSTYLYEFTYEGGLWIPDRNRTMPGVTHSEELGYIFNSKYKPSLRDALTRERMTRMWTNFAKTGNPTPKKDIFLQSTIWPKVDDGLKYLDIGKDLIVRRYPEEENMNFWDQLFAKYGSPPYDTY